MATDTPETAAAKESLTAINGEIAAASHELATGGISVTALAARLVAIEQAQERLAEELDVVRLQLSRVHKHSKEPEIVTEGEEAPFDAQKAITELTAKVDKLADTVKLE